MNTNGVVNNCHSDTDSKRFIIFLQGPINKLAKAELVQGLHY